MKVLLKENVSNVGEKGEVVSINTGYARNFIIPRGLGVQAGEKEEKRAKEKKERQEQERKNRDEKLLESLKKVNGEKVTIKSNGEENGHLYAGLNAGHIVPAINEQLGGEFHEEHLKLEEPIKEAGEHEVILEIGGKKAKVTVAVEVGE